MAKIGNVRENGCSMGLSMDFFGAVMNMKIELWRIHHEHPEFGEGKDTFSRGGPSEVGPSILEPPRTF